MQCSVGGFDQEVVDSFGEAGDVFDLGAFGDDGLVVEEAAEGFEAGVARVFGVERFEGLDGGVIGVELEDSLGACSSATSTAAESFRRVERRTSLTSGSFDLIASSSGLKASSCLCWASPRSAALSFLPLYSGSEVVTNSSIGSIRSSTS